MPLLRDITDKREASEVLRKNVFCDHLTGLANRRAFFEAAELELERSRHAPRPTALVVVDVDHFKGINDSFGHPAGDAVLRHLAVAAKSTFREVDVVARIGGDEFVVLLPPTGLDGVVAVAVAERLRALIDGKGVVVDGDRIDYSVSIGVAAMDDCVIGLDALIKRADQARRPGAVRVQGGWTQPGQGLGAGARNRQRPSHPTMKQSDYLDGYEALMQFLYRAPIGLVQTSLEGNVEMLNPMASSLLMPLALRLLDAIDKPFQVLGQQIVCTVSMGLVWGALPATPTRRCARPSEVAATAMPYSRQ